MGRKMWLWLLFLIMITTLAGCSKRAEELRITFLVIASPSPVPPVSLDLALSTR